MYSSVTTNWLINIGGQLSVTFVHQQQFSSCMVAADDGIEASAVVCLRHPLKGTKGAIRGAPLLQFEVSTVYVQVIDLHSNKDLMWDEVTEYLKSLQMQIQGGKQRIQEAMLQAVDFLLLLIAEISLGTLAKVSDENFGAVGYTYTIIAFWNNEGHDIANGPREMAHSDFVYAGGVHGKLIMLESK
ncbi:hypothetical protein Tco_0842017 [Tanacetum coccineum]|uniref:ABC transporter family G domain-containing protein n=1 Tax=Tanacetum coccineum TaxID=301880 RepID=A0ABQ5AYM3_9ASTR